MEIVYDEESLEKYIKMAAEVSPEHPVLVDKFLEDAFEFDVDAICDGEQTLICGCMQHIEEAGVHSGDSSCVLPPYMLSDENYQILKDQTIQLSRLLDVRGLMNVQFALYEGEIFVLEVNPRASRTVPFVSKATGIPWAKIGARVMAGETLAGLDVHEADKSSHISVKSPVFPFMKFQNVQTYLGPEMRSTGEVMGIDDNMGGAYAKALFAAGHHLNKRGQVFISVNDNDKASVIPIARQLYELGFSLVATLGTYKALRKTGIPVKRVLKVAEGRPHITDHIINGEIQLVINTPKGKIARSDEYSIGRAAMAYDVPCLTTLSASWAAVQAIRTLQAKPLDILALQDMDTHQK
jgi:carbamoyl-phosphate synthase large subunit